MADYRNITYPLKVPCPVCKAKRGEHCRDKKGRETHAHYQRSDLWVGRPLNTKERE